jgi:protein-tyrosine phosphatase
MQRMSIAIGLMSVLTLAGCTGETAPPASVVPVNDRHVKLEGQSNFRDLGGYRTTDGRSVKWGEVFRSGELPKLTETDVARLEELQIRTVVNFLLPQEIAKHGPDRLPSDTREVPLPIASERAAEHTKSVHAAIGNADFTNFTPELNPMFHQMLAEDGTEQYAALLREALDPGNRPLVFHCSHGVHRTGTATAILLSALGVPWETIREEYLLTNDYRGSETEATLAKIRGMAAEKQGIAPEQVDMTNVDAFYILEGSYIDGTLQAAVESHGSMDAYIRDGLGITDAEVAQLRTQLLETGP